MDVFSFIQQKIAAEKKLLFVLIDPEDVGFENAAETAKQACCAGADAILVGGTVGVQGEQLDETVKAIKEACSKKIPVLLFPSDISGVSKFADAILFMSLLNSRNPYYISGVQALAAPLIVKHGLQSIPMAYLIVEPGQETAAGWVGDVRPLPVRKPKLTATYALAAKLMGMKLIYLEAGSGAAFPVDNKIIELTKKAIGTIPLIVGGGIKDAKTAAEKAKAGADIIVVGTAFEKANVLKKVSEFVKAVKAVKER